jgi:hypothetical protein
MPTRKPTVNFELEWSSEAWAELRTLPGSERRPVMEAARGLATADREPSSASEKTLAELRIEGGQRLLYRVVDPLPSSSPAPSSPAAGLRPRVQILCAIVESATGAAVARPGAAELRRRAETLSEIGGGIPHEVVRRAWLAELRRHRG